MRRTRPTPHGCDVLVTPCGHQVVTLTPLVMCRFSGRSDAQGSGGAFDQVLAFPIEMMGVSSCPLFVRL